MFTTVSLVNLDLVP